MSLNNSTIKKAATATSIFDAYNQLDLRKSSVLIDLSQRRREAHTYLSICRNADEKRTHQFLMHTASLICEKVQRLIKLSQRRREAHTSIFDAYSQLDLRKSSGINQAVATQTRSAHVLINLSQRRREAHTSIFDAYSLFEFFRERNQEAISNYVDKS
jgi:hypothetical protein